MYKYFIIKTNRVTLKKSINQFKNNIVEREEVISPRPLPQQNVVSNIIYIKVLENSKNYNKATSFNQCIELSEDEYNNKTKLIEYKW
ncbi:hypothetical protein [Aliarcobacter cryaerophilus]|uniref:hypothetical protein n=1 Tax=Aliarcobacter cryaerophilus TaxID=28198 RepID=UPI0021B69921|nr:hypothetical protein [Aliarcobacter cryaerophilus]MCT7541625.1 hypothetical protein [Aliarcobacter cryaerophilus]